MNQLFIKKVVYLSFIKKRPQIFPVILIDSLYLMSYYFLKNPYKIILKFLIFYLKTEYYDYCIKKKSESSKCRVQKHVSVCYVYGLLCMGVSPCEDLRSFLDF